jgi:hypothetical protein
MAKTSPKKKIATKMPRPSSMAKFRKAPVAKKAVVIRTKKV